MKCVLAYIICLLLQQQVAAQKTFTVNPGEHIMYSIPAEEMYAYPAFKDGIVYFKDKSMAGGRLNYNYMLQELYFVNEKGDSTALANPEETDSVVLGNDKFYFSEIFIQHDTIASDTKLASTYLFIPSEKQIAGPFGITSSTVSNIGYVQYKANSAWGDMLANEIITFAKTKTFFLGNKSNRFVLLNKKNLFAFYSKNDAALKNYLQQNAFDYYNRLDIIKLILFMNTQ